MLDSFPRSVRAMLTQAARICEGLRRHGNLKPVDKSSTSCEQCVTVTQGGSKNLPLEDDYAKRTARAKAPSGRNRQRCIDCPDCDRRTARDCIEETSEAQERLGGRRSASAKHNSTGPQSDCSKGRCGSVGLMGPFDSRAVANRILDSAERLGKRLTMMQLIKLVYIAHGWWLKASNGQPLTQDTPEAWQYGPVNRKVYQAFRSFGSRQIPVGYRASDPATGFPYFGSFSKPQVQMIDSVVSNYGDMHAYRLSDITHQPGTPWSIASENHGYYAPIPNELVHSHFNDLYRQRTAS